MKQNPFYVFMILTLFALVLVIGTVVDDSIVVVEAVKARFDAGYKDARKATVDAMSRLTPALLLLGAARAAP